MNEFPNIAEIKELAPCNVPAFLKLNNSFIDYGDASWYEADGNQKEWELYIDYEMRLSPSECLNGENLDKFQKWSKQLQKSIRRDWPRETVQVIFKEGNRL
jgi:hypothetical protein